MEILMKAFESAKMSIQEQGENAAGLPRKLERLEDLFLQHSFYTTSMLYLFANFVKDLAAKMGYKEPIEFPAFCYVDPDFVHEQRPPRSASPPPTPPPQTD